MKKLICPLCLHLITPFKYWDTDRDTGEKVYDDEWTVECEERVKLDNGQALCHYQKEDPLEYDYNIGYDGSRPIWAGLQERFIVYPYRFVITKYLFFIEKYELNNQITYSTWNIIFKSEPIGTTRCIQRLIRQLSLNQINIEHLLQRLSKYKCMRK